jgi:hypothetical protein
MNQFSTSILQLWQVLKKIILVNIPSAYILQELFQYIGIGFGIPNKHIDFIYFSLTRVFCLPLGNLSHKTGIPPLY